MSEVAVRIPLPEPIWYVCMATTRLEFKAAAELRRAGYYTWLPFVTIKKNVRCANSTAKRIVTENRAYYSGYLFVGLKYEGQGLGDIRGVDCVSSVVKTPITGEPLRVPASVIERISALGDGTEFIREIDEVSAKSRKKYRKGQSVRLTGTAFDDFVAQVERDIGGPQLWVEVDVLGGRRRVAVKPEQISDKVAA